MSRKTTITNEQIQQLVDKNNLVWIDKVNPGSHGKLNCICRVCGRDTNPRYHDLRAGHTGCKLCAMRKIATGRSSNIEKVRNILKKVNLKLLDEFCKNNKTHVGCVCLICGFVFKIRPDSALQGHGCPVCAKEKRKQTCLEKYGTEFSCQNKEIQDKMSKSQNRSFKFLHWKLRKFFWGVGGYEEVVVKFLNKIREDYWWQPKVFVTPFKTKTGKFSTYRPDLFLVERNLWVEIKGYFHDEEARLKWEWFHKEFPNSELWDQKKLKEMGLLK